MEQPLHFGRTKRWEDKLGWVRLIKVKYPKLNIFKYIWTGYHILTSPIVSVRLVKGDMYMIILYNYHYILVNIFSRKWMSQ